MVSARTKNKISTRTQFCVHLLWKALGSHRLLRYLLILQHEKSTGWRWHYSFVLYGPRWLDGVGTLSREITAVELGGYNYKVYGPDIPKDLMCFESTVTLLISERTLLRLISHDAQGNDSTLVLSGCSRLISFCYIRSHHRLFSILVTFYPSQSKIL